MRPARGQGGGGGAHRLTTTSGRRALALWRDEGIDASCVAVAPGEPSGIAQIWVYEDGDNSIVVAPGAGAGLGAAEVAQADALIAAASVVMASCEVPLEATLAAFERARQAGTLTVLNPAPFRALPPSLLALCTCVHAQRGRTAGPGRPRARCTAGSRPRRWCWRKAPERWP